jgi:hypothetical protein
MIEPLRERYTWGCGAQLPNTIELMKKINELVEEVNRLKKKLEEE